MAISVRYKKAPFYLYLFKVKTGKEISCANDLNNLANLEDISAETNCFFCLSDGENTVTYKPDSGDYPIENYSNYFKRIYISETVLDALNTGYISQYAGFDNTDSGNELRDDVISDVIFDLQNPLVEV